MLDRQIFPCLFGPTIWDPPLVGPLGREQG